MRLTGYNRLQMNNPPGNQRPPETTTMAYARAGETVTPTDPFDRQVVGLFRGFIYLMVLLPCAAAIIAVAGLMMRRH